MCLNHCVILGIFPKLGEKKRMSKCIYCNKEITEERALDVCNSCGVGVWGEKMFRTILENMEGARADGTLLNSDL